MAEVLEVEVKQKLKLAVLILNRMLQSDQTPQELSQNIEAAYAYLGEARILAFRQELLTKVERPPASERPPSPNNVIHFKPRTEQNS